MGYNTIKINKRANGVTRVTIDNGAVNLWSWKFVEDMNDFMLTLYDNSETKVVIFDSANPDFFIAHYDLMPATPDALPLETQIDHAFNGILFKISKLPTIFIAEIAGRARGVGSEFLAQCDLRFAARGKALIGQLEVTLGLFPGAGGMPYLVSHLGRAKALEVILSGRDIDADTAESINLINKAYNEDELTAKVDEFADRIALFESDALAAVKERVNLYSRPKEELIMEDSQLFFDLLLRKRQTELKDEFLKLTNNQAHGQYEIDVNKIIPKLY